MQVGFASEKKNYCFLYEFGSPELEALIFLIKMFVVVDIVKAEHYS